MLALHANSTPGALIRLSRRAWLGGLLGACTMPGCRLKSDALPQVLTSLPDDRLRPVLRELGVRYAHVSRPIPPGDPVVAYQRGAPADLLVGGPWWSYACHLKPLPPATAGDTAPSSHAKNWLPWGRSSVGLWVEDELAGSLSPGQSLWSLGIRSDLRGRLWWADPRTDGVLLLAAAGHLTRRGTDGYADIVRWVACSRPVFRATAKEHHRPFAVWGDADSVDLGAGRKFIADPEIPPFIQGFAVVAQSDRAAGFRELFASFDPWSEPDAPQLAAAGAPAQLQDNPFGLSLLGDLLYATLIENLPEFQQTWAAIWRDSGPSVEGRKLAEHWVVQPPPWPPASVEQLRTRPRFRELLTRLVSQLSLNQTGREWLIAQFEGGPRPVDAGLLAEIGSVASGMLASEPCFRNWLLAEWSAWAGQRYRRAARLAEGKGGTGA